MPVTIDDIRRAARTLHGSVVRTPFLEAPKLSDVTVIIRADKDARTGKVQEMIEASQEAEFETFALRGQQSDVELRTTE